MVHSGFWLAFSRKNRLCFCKLCQSERHHWRQFLKLAKQLCSFSEQNDKNFPASMAGEFGEDAQRRRGGGMKIAALLDSEQFHQCEGVPLHGFSVRTRSTAFAKHFGQRQSAPGTVDGGSGGKSSHQQPPILHSNAWPHSGQVLIRVLDAQVFDVEITRKASSGPVQSNNSG